MCTNARRETPLQPLLRRPAGVRVLVLQICQGMDAHRDVGDGVNAAASVRATVLPNGNRLSEICYLNHGPDEFAATLLRDSSLAMRLQSEATEARTHLCWVLKSAIVNKRSFYYVECMAKGLLPQQHCQVLDPGSLCPIGSAFGVGVGEHPRPGCRDGGAGAEAPKLIKRFFAPVLDSQGVKKSKLSRESRSCLTNLLPVRARDAALLYVSATEAKHRSSGDDVDGVSTGRGKKAAAAGSERWSILGQGLSAHVTPSVVAYLLACFFCVRTAVDVLRHKSDGESPLQAPDSPIVARCPGNRQHDRVVVVIYNHYVVPLGLPDGAPAATSVGGVIRGETTSLGARHFERCLAIASLTHFVDPAWVGKWANACASLLRVAAAWDSSCVATLRDELERLYKFVKDKGLPWFRSIFSGSISEVVLWNLFQRLALSPFPGGRRTAVSVRNHISNKIREARNEVLVAKRAGEAQDSASPMKDVPKASAGGSEGAGAGRPQEAHLPSAPEEIRRPVELSAAGRLVAEDSATEASRQTADSATQL